jgi:hypothetical protein
MQRFMITGVQYELRSALMPSNHPLTSVPTLLIEAPNGAELDRRESAYQMEPDEVKAWIQSYEPEPIVEPVIEEEIPNE